MGIFSFKNNKILKAQMPIMVTPLSRWSIGDQLAAGDIPAISSGNMNGANNRAFAYPLVIPAPCVIVKAFIHNGASVAGNVDIGLYYENYTKVVTAGGAAQVGVNLIQEFDLTDTVVQPGRYYLVGSASGAATAKQWVYGGEYRLALMGCFVAETAYPLPATLTPTAPTTLSVGVVNLMGLSLRTLVA